MVLDIFNSTNFYGYNVVSNTHVPLQTDNYLYSSYFDGTKIVTTNLNDGTVVNTTGLQSTGVVLNPQIAPSTYGNISISNNNPLLFLNNPFIQQQLSGVPCDQKSVTFDDMVNESKDEENELVDESEIEAVTQTLYKDEFDSKGRMKLDWNLIEKLVNTEYDDLSNDENCAKHIAHLLMEAREFGFKESIKR